MERVSGCKAKMVRIDALHKRTKVLLATLEDERALDRSLRPTFLPAGWKPLSGGGNKFFLGQHRKIMH